MENSNELKTSEGIGGQPTEILSSSLSPSGSTTSDPSSSNCTVKFRKRRKSGPEDHPEEEEEVEMMAPVVDRRIPVTLEQHVDLVLNAQKLEYTCQDPSCTKKFQNLEDYNEHYALRHMYKCAECKKCLPGSYFLELHVLETHDTLFSLMAERKPMYACLAEECTEKFSTPDERYEHFHVFHKKHPLFWTFKHFENISEKQSHKGQNKKKQNAKKQSAKKQETESMEVEPTQEGSQNDLPRLESKAQEKSPPGGSKGSKGVKIHFGHHAAKFRPWHATAGQKGQVSGEKIMDLSSIEDVLKSPKTKPNPEQIMDLSAVEKALENGQQESGSSTEGVEIDLA